MTGWSLSVTIYPNQDTDSTSSLESGLPWYAIIRETYQSVQINQVDKREAVNSNIPQTLYRTWIAGFLQVDSSRPINPGDWIVTVSNFSLQLVANKPESRTEA